MKDVRETDVKIGMVVRPAIADRRDKDEDDRLFLFKQQVNTMLVEWVGQQANKVVVAGRHVFNSKLLSNHGHRPGDPCTMTSYDCGRDFIILSNPYMPDGKGWTDDHDLVADEVETRRRQFMDCGDACRNAGRHIIDDAWCIGA